MKLTRLIWLAFISASTSWAQFNTWSLDRVAGTSVMDEVSALTFRASNSGGSTANLQQFTIGLPTGQLDIDTATAATGWRVTSIDRQSKSVTFTAAGCAASAGLAPGQAANFQVRVVGGQSATDQTSQDFLFGLGGDPCGTGALFGLPGGTHTWTLVGLDARLTTSVRTMALGDQVSLSLTIANDSTATQSSLTPTTPTVAGTATFSLVSGPTPASVSSLAKAAATTFVWVYKATGRGSAVFSAGAKNSNVTSPLVTTSEVSVGLFPTAAFVGPEDTVTAGVVKLQVRASNNSGGAMTNVTPSQPGFQATGAATAVLTAGPSPTVEAALATRATTAFTTSWKLTGNPGDTVTFSGSATAITSTLAPTSSTPNSATKVTIQALTLTALPASVFSGAGTSQIRYTLTNGGALPISSIVLMTPDANLFRTGSAVGTPAGWASTTSSTPAGIRFAASNTANQIAVGGKQTFTLSFATIGTIAATTPVSHKAQVTYTDGSTARASATVAVAAARTVPEVIVPVALAVPTKATLTWSNPSLHDGVLILRAAGAAPNTPPAAGTRYTVGSTLGNATVAYEDAAVFSGTFSDTGLSNGTQYYYRLFNRDEYSVYSPANVPASSPSNYLLVIPPGTTGSDAHWCTTVGLPALQQPFVDLGKAVYQSSNGSFFTAASIGAPVPGGSNEKWRPSFTRGVVQARPTALALGAATQPSIFVGDQLGFAYRLNAETGGITWTGNGGVALGEVIQAQALVVTNEFASATFSANFPSGLVFFGTRNSTTRSSNSVKGLALDTGSVAMTYQPGNLDQITGPLLFDFTANLLWVASLSTAGPSLRVIDVNNPTAAPRLLVSDLGDLPSGVVRNGNLNQAMVVDKTGIARGYSLSSLAKVWQVSVGDVVTSPPVTYLTDFFVSGATSVQRYHVDSATAAVTKVWSTALRLPTSVRINAVAGKAYVGDGDGFLRRLDLSTGAIESSVKVSTSGAVSMPAFDSTAALQRIYVGTADGRLCVFPTTF